MFPHTFLVLAALCMNNPRPEIVAKNVKNAPQLESEVGDISGYYTCKGMEVGGKTYSGVTAITRKGDVYVVQWMVGSGSTFTGIGIRQGNTFSASWAMAGERGLVKGINTYRIETASGGPRLTGRWTSMPGPGVLQSETLTFLKQMDEEE
jgi:hypothetical protein